MSAIGSSTSPMPPTPAQPPAAPSEPVPLEPTTELPRAPDGGTSPTARAALGATGLFGGALLTSGIAGVTPLALSIATNGPIFGVEHTRGRTMALAAIPGAILGGAFGATIGANLFQTGSVKRAQRELDEANGVATLDSARRLIGEYDHSGDASIQLDNDTGIASRDERVRMEERTRTERSTRLGMDGEWHTSSHRVGEVKTHSAGGIFTAADAEPKDRVVTEQELARLMSTFDTDRNGVLSSTERREFDERHPVVVEDWRDR